MKVFRRSRRLLALARFAYRVRGIVDSKITIEEAKRVIAEGVRNRERRFLSKLELAVYSNRHSPYLKLLRHAGCELDDVHKLVESDGLEGALRTLANNGVYLTYEEFKCRTPTVRGSRTFHFRLVDFDDPNIRPDSYGSSGGTRGKAVETKNSSEKVYRVTPAWAIFIAENKCLTKPLSFWNSGTVESTSRQLACARFSQPFSTWFISEDMTTLKDRFYHAARRRIVMRTGRFPDPEWVPYNRAEIILDRVLVTLSRGAGMCLNTAPSAAVKISLAARERGVSLTGLTFLLGAEPLTAARRCTIEAAGAVARPLYGTSEASWIGGQCSSPEHPDEVHLLEDCYAAIPAQHAGSESSEPAPFLLTSLSPISSKVLLNTDIGDLAVFKRRSCACFYDEVGCGKVLHTIRSSDKITAFGVTFAVADVFQVLEADLPKKFGGAVGDYQLVEECDEEGLPRYKLVVSPRVKSLSEYEVVPLFLRALGKRGRSYGLMANIWRRAGILECIRSEPLATSRGKVLPFFRAG